VVFRPNFFMLNRLGHHLRAIVDDSVTLSGGGEWSPANAIASIPTAKIEPKTAFALSHRANSGELLGSSVPMGPSPSTEFTIGPQY
jgi:hypothetical protein